MIAEIEQKKQRLLAELTKFEESDAKYRYIIEKGRQLEPLTPEQKDDKYLIEGCISKAWLAPELRGDRLYFHAESEAAIVKGIMAILIEVYSGNTPTQNLNLSPDFLREGGITEHLSLNRRNGLSSVVKQIMLYSSAFKALASLTR
jgi:cysteine desulfuration protein SufE